MTAPGFCQQGEVPRRKAPRGQGAFERSSACRFPGRFAPGRPSLPLRPMLIRCRARRTAQPRPGRCRRTGSLCPQATGSRRLTGRSRDRLRTSRRSRSLRRASLPARPRSRDADRRAAKPAPAIIAPPTTGSSSTSHHVVPVLTATGAEPVAVFESLVAENNFPQLPLRDEVVLAWFARFPGAAAYDQRRRQLAASRDWRERMLPELVCRSAKPTQELRLSPTARSRFR